MISTENKGLAKRVAVVGCGNIGRSVAVDLLMHDIPVTLIDLSEDILQDAKKEIMQIMRLFPILNSENTSVTAEKPMREHDIKLAMDLSELLYCDFIIENIVEQIDVKHALYYDMEPWVGNAKCVCVNTSCIPIHLIGERSGYSEKIAGVHFMNPSYLKPVVEVIPSKYTSEGCLGMLKVFLAQINKKTVFAKDEPGFISNRISHIFMNEAALLVQNQKIAPHDVDAIFEKCFGHSMGPLKTADLIGIDTVAQSLDILHSFLRSDKYICCDLLREMVAKGHLGRKVEQGFYIYN